MKFIFLLSILSTALVLYIALYKNVENVENVQNATVGNAVTLRRKLAASETQKLGSVRNSKTPNPDLKPLGSLANLIKSTISSSYSSAVSAITSATSTSSTSSTSSVTTLASGSLEAVPSIPSAPGVSSKGCG